MKTLLYSKWKNDECYTPAYWVEPIIKYIKKYKEEKCDIDVSNIDQNAIRYFNWKFTDLKIISESEKFIAVETPISDEWWSNYYGIEKKYCNLKYIKNIIWCPFDTEKSEFVIQLKQQWFEVINSHIEDWQDFYKYKPDDRDIIVSNPPFTNKRKIFERCLWFWKPFALLMSNTWLNDAAPKQLFEKKDLQLLMFDKRIEYNGIKKITFSSSYFCFNILPKQIICEKLNK